MRASAARHAECCAFLSFHETPEFCGPLYGNVTMQNSSHVGVRRQIKPGDHAACRNSCEAAVIGGELNSNTTLRGMRNTDTWPMVKAPLSAHNHDDAVLSRFARMAPKTVCMWSAEQDMVFPAGQPGYVPGFMTGNTDPCLSWAREVLLPASMLYQCSETFERGAEISPWARGKLPFRVSCM